MNDRTRRTAPRTLSATPPPSPRAPRATGYVTVFPSLAAVIAGASGCHEPACSETRAAELEAHGAAAMSTAREGHTRDALREIGVALGVAAHPAARAPERFDAPGQMPAVTTTGTVLPTVPVVPQIESDGNAVEVSPLPTTVPHTPTQPTVAPHPPDTTTATPRPRPHPTMGRMRSVTPANRGGFE